GRACGIRTERIEFADAKARVTRRLRQQITPASFAELLRSAITEPGIISNCYRAFHDYSMGNQLLAWAQCAQRGIAPGPISTFVGWKTKNRYVRKGEKAITLCMPVTIRRKSEERTDDDQPEVFTRFVYRRIGSCSRPVLLDAVAALKRGDVLLIAKRDRLGRDVIAVAMIERLIERKGARVVSAAGEGTDSNDPTVMLMRRIV